MMASSQRVILASQSAARQHLLRQAGILFEAMPADIDERGIQGASGLRDGGAIAKLLAREKALHVSRLHSGHYVVGADQTLTLGDRIFSKPSSRASAAEQITALSGRTHELHSAVTVVKDAAVLFTDLSVARMTMRTLDDRTREAYLDQAGERITASVGAYQLESLGVNLFERIEGDYFTILGLPLLPLLGFLRTLQLTAF